MNSSRAAEWRDFGQVEARLADLQARTREIFNRLMN